MNMIVNPISDMGFRPETFFLGQTSGRGVARDAFGRIISRYVVDVRGAQSGAYGGLKLDHTLVFETGAIEAMTWLITAAGSQSYLIADPESGLQTEGRLTDGDFTASGKRRFHGRFGSIKGRFQTRLTLLAVDTAMAQTKISVLGAPLASLTAFHHKLS